MTTHHADDATIVYIAQLEQENAELRKDAERLDWLDSKEMIELRQDSDAYWYLRIGEQQASTGYPFIRGALDSAKESQDAELKGQP